MTAMTGLSLPQPLTPDPMAALPVRWGVLGPGKIAHSFARALRDGTRQDITAVGSRSRARARAFAEEFGVPAAYGSYAELVADPHVDVVYVASPHSEHHDHAMLAIEAGKSVLVEKAFTRSIPEAEEVLAAGRERGVFVMEAMWTRFLPHLDVVRHAVETGLLGQVHTVIADHGQQLYPGGPERLAAPELAGGALLDLGVYPLSFASMVLGELGSLSAVGSLTEDGVDAQTSIVARTPSGQHAVLSASMVAKTPTTAVVCGTSARLEIAGDFYQPATITLRSPRGEVLDVREPAPEERTGGLRYEAAEVARCLHDGALESALMPGDETLRVMELMDEVRRQVGVRYPGE
jgi:predicted dehydrogenase